MIRSMFTSISALNMHQKYLDVTANNLANANTNGYKSSRVLFHDQFSQILAPGSGPTDVLGGTNPTQIGLGVRLGYVSPNFTRGDPAKHGPQHGPSAFRATASLFTVRMPPAVTRAKAR
ncbi:MAG: hypothetical protein HND47_07310 [Chloroflexi bacterium]|nr:hypothetical protein [Chloroflexota bacterium]